MSSEQQEKAELDRKAKEGETVVPRGTGGKSLEAQQHLAEGRKKGGEHGGHSRKEGEERTRGNLVRPDQGIDVDESTM